MASSTANHECRWWIEKDDGNLYIHRIKNNASMRIPIEKILPMPSSTTHITVTTTRPGHGIIDKKFSLKDFQCKRNDISSLMENAVETGQQFADRFSQLFLNTSTPQSFEGGILHNAATGNIITDACELEAINGKRVKFGNDYTIEVPVALLSSPPQQRLVRQVNQAHVQDLRASLQKHGIVFNNLTVHVPNQLPTNINRRDIMAGRYPLETVGGNHTRQAIAELKEQFVNVPVIVYAGLTNAQALMVGYEHNRLHLNSRPMTFEEDVLLFRRKIVGDPDEGLSQQQRTQWRQQMAGILGLPVKDIRVKYRVHTFLAGQHRDIWMLIKQFMGEWEQKAIKGQPLVNLKPSHLRFLEPLITQEAIKDTLSRILAGDLSYQDARRPGKAQPIENGSSPKKRTTEASLKEWEARLVSKEAKINERETRLTLMEKPIQESKATQTEAQKPDSSEDEGTNSSEELQTTPVQLQPEVGMLPKKKPDSSEDEGTNSTEELQTTPVQLQPAVGMLPKKIRMANGKTCMQGEWVAVLYGRKASVGRVVDLTSEDRATVQFLKGKKLNCRDIQDVTSKFMICLVDVQHDIDKEEIIIPDKAKEEIMRETDLYIQTYM